MKLFSKFNITLVIVFLIKVIKNNSKYCLEGHIYGKSFLATTTLEVMANKLEESLFTFYFGIKDVWLDNPHQAFFLIKTEHTRKVVKVRDKKQLSCELEEIIQLY